ncbi:MAG: DNA-3-methyladenine glycosylase I [Pseudomonadota bacterium]
MRSFEKILDLASQHYGGAKGVKAKLGEHPHILDLSILSDDRVLAEMTRRIFQSGFVWKVIDAKWEGFEAAFDGFDPHRVAFYSDEDLDRLMGDTRIVRNGAKIAATLHNARFVVEVAKEAGSFCAFLANWPSDDQIGLLEVMKARGKRLSGMTGQYFLRFIGWDAFILSNDVSAALIREGVVDKPPTSKAAMKAVQAAFNEWADQSGRPRREISRVLALSIGPS